MHAYYEYNAGASAANVLSDIVKLLTGTTDKTQLSADTVQFTTNILSVVPAGWVVYDNGGAPGVSVMLASDIDVSNFNGNQAALTASIAAGRTSANSKFMMVSMASANYIMLRPCESSTTARVVINECQNAGTPGYQQKINLAQGGFIRLNASARHCAIYTHNKAVTVFGNNLSSSPTCVFERTRRSAWDTNTAAYPVSVFMAGGVGIDGSQGYNGGSMHLGATPSFPRIRSTTGGDVVGALAAGIHNTGATSSITGNGVNGYFGITPMTWCTDPITGPLPSADGSLKHMMRPLWPGVPTQGFAGGDISVFADFWQFSSNCGNVGDTTQANGKTYEIWAGQQPTGFGGGFRYAVRMG